MANPARYLGLHVDSKRIWKEHVRKKRDHIKSLHRNYYWLLGYHFNRSLENRRLIYVWIMRLSWTYGVHTRGITKMSNKLIIQRAQNKLQRYIAKVLWYISNEQRWTASRSTVNNVEKKTAQTALSHVQHLHRHQNWETIQLLPARQLHFYKTAQ